MLVLGRTTKVGRRYHLDLGLTVRDWLFMLDLEWRIASSIGCGEVKKPFHGSDFNEARRRPIFVTLKRAGVRAGPNSSQRTGVETGAPALALVEYAATAVAPRPLRR